MDMVRGTVAIRDPLKDEIAIEVAHGMTRTAMQRGKYKLGEGVTGRVIETGKAVTIPKISEDPTFLDRTASRKAAKDRDLSFICVPIKKGKQVVGALSADRPIDNAYPLKEAEKMLSVVATMIAQHVINLEKIRIEKDQLREENRRLLGELENKYRFTNIVGNSNKMREVFQMVSQVSRSNATVLIRGESGTGKELVANSIHYNSLRSKGPFIKVNCAALPQSVIESELFGHERGAFTGADKMKKGRFELANHGTLFLDEIGDLSFQTQIALLRVLQEREFERVGGTETIGTDVRIITATNRNLESLVDEGRFREDLYFRLNVFPIHIAPLRERKGDLLLLSDHFVEKYSREHGKSIRRISTPAIDMLMCYHWPGNVRELENCIERAVLVSNDEVIHGHHLPPTLQTAEFSGTVSSRTLPEAVEALERNLIEDALKSSRGNKAKAARALGITERLMGIKVDKLDIDYRRYRTNR
jgi:Nif-specific regulatory protein